MSQLATKTQSQVQVQGKSFSELLKAKVSNVLHGKRGEQFVIDAVALVQRNKALAECEQMSLISSMLQAQSLNLSLNSMLGQVYIVPFNNKKKCNDWNKAHPANERKEFLEATFQLGYKGYIQLAIRSGQYRKINVLAIKEGELELFDPLNEEIVVNLIQDDVERENTPTIGYYAMFEYTNGFRKAMYWSKAKMLAHADRYSQAFSLHGTRGKYVKVSYADFEAGKYDKKDEWMYSSFWYKDFDGMAYKTMLRQIISKWGVMSIEMQQAYEADMNSSKNNDDDVIDTPFVEVEEQSIQNLNAAAEAAQQTDHAEPTADEEQEAKKRTSRLSSAEMEALRAEALTAWEDTGGTQGEAEKLVNAFARSWNKRQCERILEAAQSVVSPHAGEDEQAQQPASQATQGTASTDAETTTQETKPMIYCPKHDEDVFQSNCKGCQARQGCPSWDNE
ncbi:MAG: recombinase RecT [Desulfovibrionaceae bacterium]|nr:recombinase RecT [Desulfovibrionaceae bacterium]